MDYIIKEIEPIRVAYTRYEGLIQEAKHYFKNIYKSISGKANSACFFNYISMDPLTKFGVVELCVPTFEIPKNDSVKIKTMPSIKALCTKHIGPYENIDTTYKAIEEYAKKNNTSLSFPFREVFIKGPGMFFKGNPNKYITEIQFCILENN